ncbi:MAG: peptidylprolyl isomerase [Fuerstiella sp.]|nr:peptidylprolyl isomerase [Fuerstiella sp.]MCP4852903.1 peptidylprolyl isomerase [Fuerstiella sp.]
MQQAVKDAAEAEKTRVAAEQRALLTSDDISALPGSAVPATGQFEVEFDTTVGKFTIEVNRAWAPVGAHQFYDLVRDGFFDDCGFFRVVPGFMVQFGLAADPAVTARWSKEIPDDPVVESNRRGYVTFAKTSAPDSRSSQMFINFGDNSRLDADGFSPFGKVTRGMAVVDRISAAHREQPDQGAITSQGNAYLKSNFPKLDYVVKARMIIDDLEPEATDPAATTEGKTDVPEAEDPPQVP